MRNRKRAGFMSLMMAAMMVFAAVFTACASEGALVTYKVTIAETEHGTVTSDRKQAEEGDTVTLTITPDAEYEVGEVTVSYGHQNAEVTESNGGYTFVMPAADVAVHATFDAEQTEPEPVPVTYKVMVAETEHGTVTSDRKQAEEGDTVTLTVTPDAEYEISEVTVMYSQQSIKLTETDGKYAFTMPAADVTVQATFKVEQGTEPPVGEQETQNIRFGGGYDVTLTDFSVDFDFKLDGVNGEKGYNVSFAFGGTDKDHFVMVQLQAAEDGIHVKPHKSNGAVDWNVQGEETIGYDKAAEALGEQSVTRDSFHDMAIHERVEVMNGATLKVYLGKAGTDVPTLIYEKDLSEYYGVMELGRLVIRQHSAEHESAYFDNIVVTDKNGVERYRADFEDGVNPFIGSEFIAVQDVTFAGMTSKALHAGTYTEGGIEHRAVLGETDDMNYTIDFDFRIDSKSQGMGFGYRGNDNYTFLQINVSDDGSVKVKPHDAPYTGGLRPYEEQDITQALRSAAGLADGASVLGTWLHERIEVSYDVASDKTMVRLYFAPVGKEAVGKAVYSIEFENATPFRNIVLRQSAWDNAKEVSTYDNIVVRNARGALLYYNDFEENELTACGMKNAGDADSHNDMALVDGNGGKAIRVGDLNEGGAVNQVIPDTVFRAYHAIIGKDETYTSAVLVLDRDCDVYVDGVLLSGTQKDGKYEYDLTDILSEHDCVVNIVTEELVEAQLVTESASTEVQA